MQIRIILPSLIAATLLAGCGDRAQLAPALRKPAGAAPIAAAGLRANAFATGLQHPRWLYSLFSGDVLVAESAAPPRPRGWKTMAA